ncbi:tripartite tricarboxylate transporter substrate binding protein [Bordetella sp. BOR01]|uniref:Bug family tripartite tricarboxylate transporter substrate binding protein n=1 Tax=Bordetella sp. BOR01 TaxID=2854779 RepID=UPI001C471145|nr:tripartite tricarboxylate transporter substrate binding protein [Bordetella sp. BOR01]MBV7484794.1 tripartite tricarboxylate transporter substrate binding protein [Bordetella sp. BOR01]
MTSRFPARLALRGIQCLLALAMALAAGLPSMAAAAYPDRPIRYVIPFPPGGSTDTTGRILAEEMAKILGQPVVVENRGGAGGNIGAAHVAGAPADGYTLLQGTIGTHGINPTLYDNLPFDARRDFVPIARMTAGTNVLVINPSVPAKTVQELIAYAKQNPGKLMMGSSGAGSSIHMSGELFQVLTGTRFTHVPYRGGGPAMNDLLAGHIQLMFDNLNVSLPHIQAGKVRALGVTSRTRAAVLPDVPTLMEAGVPGYEVTSWSGIFAPAGTPRDIVEKLNAAINQALSTDTVRARFDEAGIQIDLMGVDQFKAFVDSEIDRWGDIVKKSGAKAQ